MSKQKRVYDGIVYYKQSTRQLIYDYDGHEDILDNVGWRNLPRLLYWACENNVEVVFDGDDE
jgi:hypothetical protein